MTSVVAEHPLVKIFRDNGIEVLDYLSEEDGNYALIAFGNDQSAADRGMDLIRDSDVELRGLRHARYYGDDRPEERVQWEILFRSR